ncbi:curli-like amyloid fiber formation chaperone CsgH [Pseudoruegeria sp. HB172150]|uniref:curli-like amyloid fiber formation chaperone CsgH n=1 Tax=Pseudoruegeria sp. HB172150 TaxID=2721164 RepID=UPI00155169D0|nr:curli-like amyloid fiber formation chaperone CsgH [Pseudoruegeria sp. HB172150]
MTLYSIFGKFVLPAAALTGFGLAAGSAAENGADAPMKCEISVTKSGMGYTYTGKVQADEPLRGSFELVLTKLGGGSTKIRQSGLLDIAAGETATLGQATFGGLPDSVDAELILTVDGKTYSCMPQTEL